MRKHAIYAILILNLILPSTSLAADKSSKDILVRKIDAAVYRLNECMINRVAEKKTPYNKQKDFYERDEIEMRFSLLRTMILSLIADINDPKLRESIQKQRLQIFEKYKKNKYGEYTRKGQNQLVKSCNKILTKPLESLGLSNYIDAKIDTEAYLDKQIEILYKKHNLQPY